MSRSATIRLRWADGEYAFRLAIAQLEELDDLCGVGPGYALGLFNAGLHGNWKAKLLREVIRLGLIGGGAMPTAASKLVERYVDNRPLGESLLTAQAILRAAVTGVEDDAPGETEGEGTTTAPPSPTDASASPTSTAPGAPADSLPGPLATAASGKSRPTSRAGARPISATTKVN